MIFSFPLKEVPVTFLKGLFVGYKHFKLLFVCETFYLSILSNDIVSRVVLIVDFFPIRILSKLCHSLLACKVSAEKSLDSCMGFPLYNFFLSLAASKFFLSLTFHILIMCMV